MSTVKESLMEVVQRLPNKCTWDEAMSQIYIRQKIEAGMKDADEGRLIDHDLVFQEFAK